MPLAHGAVHADRAPSFCASHEADQPAAAEVPAWSAVGYLEKLPRELTEHEKRLAAAVAAFMFNWRETHEEGSRPNLVHLGANAHIRDCKALALPREVSLKVWLKHRLGDKVDVIGQSVVLLGSAQSEQQRTAA